MRVLIGFFLLMNATVLAGTLTCEGWYQEKDKDIEKAPMALASQTENDKIYSATYKDYVYQVDWNQKLTTFYTTIEKDKKRILFTTARVPTDNHPEAFTDLNLPDGPRLSVNCEVKVNPK